ncbi:hypothetical protein LAZ67_20001259 [Cordylochernes scorpioides]|uniref:Transposase n=1 Tax=Cordylochernes scorpioides TaxID=51811 RepID=A0ABY6LNN5_9ARAC|nr:hypothetical protein LAZ67_20001259 [Cordylochernes scorpioides]
MPLTYTTSLSKSREEEERTEPMGERHLHFSIPDSVEPEAFKEGRGEVADEPRSGRPTTARTDENVDRVLEVLRTDRRLSIQKIADTLHMSTFVVHGIVTEDLQMPKVCTKLVPKVLTQDQKELRVLRCQELLDLIQNEPGFLNSVVTGDESWMFEYDPESKRQSCAWHTKSSPRPKKARMSKSRIKTMIIVFFDIRGIVHCEFLTQGQTVNSAFYLEVLRRLKRRIARVRADIKDTVKLHHDNATSHTAFIITNFLARSNTPVIPHPPYSLDLAPCDFFFFLRLKREMKGKHPTPCYNVPEKHSCRGMILGKNAQNVQKITDLIKENLRTTLLELEQDTSISKTTIGRIVTKDLKLKKTPAKFIPIFLTNEQKLCRLATCENMLEITRTYPEWKDKIITGDETWVYDYDPETKRQYAE